MKKKEVESIFVNFSQHDLVIFIMRILEKHLLKIDKINISDMLMDLYKLYNEFQNHINDSDWEYHINTSTWYNSDANYRKEIDIDICCKLCANVLNENSTDHIFIYDVHNNLIKSIYIG